MQDLDLRAGLVGLEQADAHLALLERGGALQVCGADRRVVERPQPHVAQEPALGGGDPVVVGDEAGARLLQALPVGVGEPTGVVNGDRVAVGVRSLPTSTCSWPHLSPNSPSLVTTS